MGFEVDAVALGGLPDLLDRLSDDATRCRGYLVQHTGLASGGLIELMRGGHDSNVYVQRTRSGANPLNLAGLKKAQQQQL